MGKLRLSFWLVFCLLVCGCGGGTEKPAETRPRGKVSLQCDISDAEVWVNGRYFREVAEIGPSFRLRPGTHRIEVRHDSYHSMYYEIVVEAGSRQTLRVELAARLP